MGSPGSFVQEQILPMLEALSAENIGTLQGRLHILHEYCVHYDGGKASLVEGMLEANRGLAELLHDNADALGDLKDIRKVRCLGLGSNIVSQMEETISGEETFQDFIVASVATLLSWQSDSLWVKMALTDCQIVFRSHMMNLRELMWKIVSRLYLVGDGASLGSTVRIGDDVDKLLSQIVADDLPAVVKVMFIAQIYILILQYYSARLVGKAAE